MANYKLYLKPLSPFQTPLHSDTIFGHICWAIRYLYGEKYPVRLEVPYPGDVKLSLINYEGHRTVLFQETKFSGIKYMRVDVDKPGVYFFELSFWDKRYFCKFVKL